MASMPSMTPTSRDDEWKRLDQRVHMLFYAILMHGIPNFWWGIIAQGGRAAGAPIVLHVGIMPNYPRMPHVSPLRIDNAVLHSADAAMGGLISTYGAPTDFKRVKRGIDSMIDGWRSNKVLDRLH